MVGLSDDDYTTEQTSPVDEDFEMRLKALE